MTRDKHREACLEAMVAGYSRAMATMGTHGECLMAAFDSLHDIARVDPIEATEEMRAAAYEEEKLEGMTPGSALVLWRVMSEKGDLTNPPEGKP